MTPWNAALNTERLLLRRWCDTDRQPFARMNQDAAVMEYFPALLSPAETELAVNRIEAHFAQHGFGLWAAEYRGSGEFIGYVGLAVPQFQAAFTPCVEIGWRLAPEYWGRGLATEGALTVVRHGFENLKLEEIVSFTVPENIRSRRVMEKIGMVRKPEDDFDHPLLDEGHPRRRHVLYRLRNHK